MKKKIFALALLAGFSVTNAQEKTTEATVEGFNKWSIEVNGGFNKPFTKFTSGFNTGAVSPFTANLGVRYMMNNKFGIRLAGEFDSYKDGGDSKAFESKMFRVGLEGVTNLGRILNFEDWTKDLGLLAHAGAGLGFFSADAFDGTDKVGYFKAGLTPQVRLSNRVTLLLDASVYTYSRMNNTFDGYSIVTRRGFQGAEFTGTVGLQIALGKKPVHADWYYQVEEDRLKPLEERLAKAENDLASLANRLDGKEDRMNDKNGNRIPDEIEDYLNSRYAGQPSVSYTSTDVARDLIEKGYINVYFDFNSSKPQGYSLWAADFIANYLKQNPGSNVNVIGYADEIGAPNYNQTLSNKRSDVVRQLLIDRGIDASRVSSEGRGEDASVNKNSSNARQLARRATFQLR